MANNAHDDVKATIATLNMTMCTALIRPLMAGEAYVRAHSRTVSALHRRGLVQSGMPRLTPLGERVAQALLVQHRENGGRW